MNYIFLINLLIKENKMTQTQQNYLRDIRLHLEPVLNLRYFPSQLIER